MIPTRLSFVLLFALFAPQQPVSPPGPQAQEIEPPEPPRGEGIDLTVQVIDAATGQPLPGALIELKRNPVPNSAQALSDRRRWTYSKTTDRQGTVVISNIIADRYKILPTLMGYALARGATDSITLTARSKPSPILYRMWMSSAVEGTVQDHDSNPVAESVVEILEENWTAGLRTLDLAQSVKTDKDGKYTFPTVLPGTYFVRARPSSGTVQQQLKSPEQAAFVDTLYPAAIFMEQAGALTVIPGVNLSGLRIEIQKSRYYSFRGRVFGIPPEMQGRSGLVLIRRVGFDSPFPFVWSSPYDGSIPLSIAPDGSFAAPNVPPGPYWAGYTPAGAVRGGAQFEIIDRDVDDYKIEVAQGATFSGKVVYEDGTPAEPRPGDLSVFLPNMGIYARGFSANLQGQFTSTGLPEGTYRLEFQGGAVVRQIAMDGHVFQSGEFDLNAHSTPAVITLSRLGAGIQGLVDFHERARSYPRGMVTVVPVPQHPTDIPKRKYLNGNTSFAVDHLEPGRYRVCAWLEEGAEVNALLGNPHYADKLTGACETVVLSADEHKQVRLKQISAVDLR